MELYPASKTTENQTAIRKNQKNLKGSYSKTKQNTQTLQTPVPNETLGFHTLYARV